MSTFGMELTDSQGNQYFTPTNPGSVSVTGSNTKDVVLLNAVTVATVSTDEVVGGYKTLTFEVTGTATGLAITMQGKSTSGTVYTLTVFDLVNQVNVTSITTKGLYQIDVTGLVSVNADLTSVSGGSVTAQGRFVA